MRCRIAHVRSRFGVMRIRFADACTRYAAVHCRYAATVCAGLLAAAAPHAWACDPAVDTTDACPDTRWPTIVGAQYTFVRQHQSRLDSPYEGRLSLDPNGDTEQTHTIGFYFGWAP